MSTKKSLSEVVQAPNLNENELNTLERFINSKSTELDLVKKILAYYSENMKDITNIDPKGNVGLQTVARQEAYGSFISMSSLFDKDIEEYIKKPEVKKAISPWQ